VIVIQADLIARRFTAHEVWVRRFAELASAYNGKVLLIAGDSHDYRVDVAVPWISKYVDGLAPSLPNVTQVIVDASVESPATDKGAPSVIEWLRVHIDPRSPNVFSWEQVIVR